MLYSCVLRRRILANAPLSVALQVYDMFTFLMLVGCRASLRSYGGEQTVGPQSRRAGISKESVLTPTNAISLVDSEMRCSKWGFQFLQTVGSWNHSKTWFHDDWVEKPISCNANQFGGYCITSLGRDYQYTSEFGRMCSLRGVCMSISTFSC